MVNCHSIDEEIAYGLLPYDISVSRFYSLHIIHKLGNPGRQIVSSIGAPIEGISHFVDFHLGPLVRKISTYIKDVTNFKTKLNTDTKCQLAQSWQLLMLHLYMPTLLTMKGSRPVELHWKQEKSNNLPQMI